MRCIGWVLTAGTVVAVFAACGGDNGGDINGPPTNTPPVANFGVNCDGLSCTFSDSSTDAEGSIKAWQWTFGDGTAGTDQNPVNDYESAQTYSASLTVTDSGGATNSVTKSVVVAAPTADLTCTDATVAGAAATCTLTLPQAAGIRAVLTDAVPCEAHGDVIAFTAPVVDTLTADGCFATPGTQVELAASPAGTQVTLEIRSGLTQYMTAVHVSGQYPEWNLTVEDAVGAPFPPDFADQAITLTVLPSGT